jgi:hypothetical protein
MFGMLVVVFRRDPVSGQGLRTSKRYIPLILALVLWVGCRAKAVAENVRIAADTASITIGRTIRVFSVLNGKARR